MNNISVEILRSILGGYSEAEGWNYWQLFTALVIPGFGKVTCIVREIPVEDHGIPAQLVFKLVDEEGEITFFKKTGYYESYDGVDWRTGWFKQVYPKQKLVYDYE